MGKNPYDIYCIFVTSVSFLSIFFLCKRFVKDNNNKYRISLWTCVIVYTAVLPYTIIAYRYVARNISLSVLKEIPLIGAAILFLAYFCVSKKYRLFFHKTTLFTILGGIVVWMAVFLLQTNTNKQIHVSQYFLLSYLIYKAVLIDYKGKGVFVYVWFCASLLAVLDELFQGIHTTRYFSMEDVLTDTASSLGAAIFISTEKTFEDIRNGVSGINNRYISFFKEIFSNVFCESSIRYYILSVFILGIVTCCNLYFFHVDSTGKGFYRLSFMTASIILSLLNMTLLYKVFAGRVAHAFSVERFMFLFTSLVVFFIINVNLIVVISLKTKFL